MLSLLRDTIGILNPTIKALVRRYAFTLIIVVIEFFFPQITPWVKKYILVIHRPPPHAILLTCGSHDRKVFDTTIKIFFKKI